MPGKEPINPLEVQKTTAVLSVANLFSSPIFLRLGVVPSLALISLGMYSLHELGRSKHVTSKTNWTFGLFGTKKDEIKLEPAEIAYNVIKGGSMVFDAVIPPMKKP